MAKSIEIHDIPNAVYDRLLRQASVMGTSLSEYVLATLELEARPTVREIGELIAEEKPIEVTESPVAIIRELRDSGVLVLDASAAVAYLLNL